jgi:hypothetical protein
MNSVRARTFACVTAMLLVIMASCFAPPLVTGDVPTGQTDLRTVSGRAVSGSESANPTRLLPFTELVYGLTERA